MENLAFFGELLKTFRQRQHLTQQALTEQLGAHRNTIGIWERGDYLPESKILVLELAHQLGLAEQETRQLLEANLDALAPPWLDSFAAQLKTRGCRVDRTNRVRIWRGIRLVSKSL